MITLNADYTVTLPNAEGVDHNAGKYEDVIANYPQHADEILKLVEQRKAEEEAARKAEEDAVREAETEVVRKAEEDKEEEKKT